MRQIVSTLGQLAFALFSACLISTSVAHADGAAPGSELYDTVLKLDKTLFDAYNSCDIAGMEALLDDNVEFYHDKGGLSIGKAPFIDSTKKYVCGKVERQLVPATLEVYPIEGFGVIELGQHTFCNKSETPVCKDETNGIGKFFMLWQKQGDSWRLTRIVSYDHLSDWERHPPVK